MDIDKIHEAVRKADRSIGLSNEEQGLLFYSLSRPEQRTEELFRNIPTLIDGLPMELVRALIERERDRKQREEDERGKAYRRSMGLRDEAPMGNAADVWNDKSIGMRKSYVGSLASRFGNGSWDPDVLEQTLVELGPRSLTELMRTLSPKLRLVNPGDRENVVDYLKAFIDENSTALRIARKYKEKLRREKLLAENMARASGDDEGRPMKRQALEWPVMMWSRTDYTDDVRGGASKKRIFDPTVRYSRKTKLDDTYGEDLPEKRMRDDLLEDFVPMRNRRAREIIFEDEIEDLPGKRMRD